MSEQDVQDAAPILARIGEACDALADLGFPEVASALAAATRQRRGRVKRHIYPARLAGDLVALAEQAERLVACARFGSLIGDAPAAPPEVERVTRALAAPDPYLTEDEVFAPISWCIQFPCIPFAPPRDDLRVLTGGTEEETAARTRTLRNTVLSIEHDVAPDGETLMLYLGRNIGKVDGTFVVCAPRSRPGVLVTTWTDATDV